MPTPLSVAAVIHLVTRLPASHTQPTLLTQEGPSLAPLPDQHLHSDVSQPPEQSSSLIPKSSTSLPFLVPTSRSHQVSSLSPKPLACLLSPTSGQLRPTRHTPPVPPLLSRAEPSFKMQICYCHSLLQPFSGFLCLRLKAALSALAPKVPAQAALSPPSLCLCSSSP